MTPPTPEPDSAMKAVEEIAMEIGLLRNGPNTYRYAAEIIRKHCGDAARLLEERDKLTWQSRRRRVS